jgi:hypothetical protein
VLLQQGWNFTRDGALDCGNEALARVHMLLLSDQSTPLSYHIGRREPRNQEDVVTTAAAATEQGLCTSEELLQR